MFSLRELNCGEPPSLCLSPGGGEIGIGGLSVGGGEIGVGSLSVGRGEIGIGGLSVGGGEIGQVMSSLPLVDQTAGEVFVDDAGQQGLVGNSFLPGAGVGEVEVALGYP